MASITTFLELIDMVLGEAAYGAYTDWGAVADRNYAIIEAAIKDAGGSVTAGGTANALTVTANVGFTTYQNGRLIGFVAASDNTGAATLNVNAIGVKAIQKIDVSGAVALVGGEIQAGCVHHVVYNSALNGGAGAWLLLDQAIPVTGIFTPTLKFGGASVGMTYTTQSGEYSRIGSHLVFFTIGIVLSAKGSSVGTATITGLPFTAATSIALAVSGAANFSGMTGAIQANTFAGSAQVNLFQTSATGSGALQDTVFTNTSTFIASGYYLI